MYNFSKGGKTKKAIEKIIMFKMMGWLKSIKDEELREEVKKNLIVSGGCIASMLLGEEVNDYDVYIRDANVAKKLSQYYMDKLGEKSSRVSKIEVNIEPTGGWVSHVDTSAMSDDSDYNDPVYWAMRELSDEKKAQILELSETKQLKIMIKSAGLAGEDTDLSTYRYFESMPFSEVLTYFEKGFKNSSNKSYQLLFMSSNAISLSDGIQIITRFIGEPHAIHKCFDFVHVKNYFTFGKGLVLNAEAMESLLSKQLVYNYSMYPVSSIFRIRKFLKRGWTISAGEMFKIMMDISNLKLTSPMVLMEQLTGADVAYFREVLYLIKDKKEVDKTYLFEIIDRVFKTNQLDDVDFSDEEITEISDEIKSDAISLGLEDDD